METIKKSYQHLSIKMDARIRIILSIIMIVAMSLIITAFTGCIKSEPPQEPDPVSTQTGEVAGTVKDENGNPYPNSLIIISKGSEKLEAYTSVEGKYEGTTKSVGTYTVTLVPPLSTEVVVAKTISIDVQANQTSTHDFVIKPLASRAHLNLGSADIFGQVRNANGNLPTSDNEPLYAANTYQSPIGFLKPIKAPDGHIVSLSEFKVAKGSMKVTCNGNNSTINIAFEGLIPNGTYTVWLAYLNTKKKVGEAIGFNDWVYTNKPPIGSANGAENVLIAEADGTINVTKQHASCILTDEVALVIPLIYHINGKTYGGGEIPDAEQVAHLLVYFQ